MIVALVITGLIAIAGQIDIPGVSKIVRPVERGTGSKCADGNVEACKDLAEDLCHSTMVRCEVVVEGGGAKQSGGNPGQKPGGGGPPPNPPPPNPPPPNPPPNNGGPLERVCHINVLGVRVCVRVGG